MSVVGETRSLGDVGSMSGLPESGHGWAIYEYTPYSRRFAVAFFSMCAALVQLSRSTWSLEPKGTD
jgi:hypothetical protein